MLQESGPFGCSRPRETFRKLLEAGEITLLMDNEYKSIPELIAENKKLWMKNKILEISFEQINNSRNDMIRQLAECEAALGKK